MCAIDNVLIEEGIRQIEKYGTTAGEAAVMFGYFLFGYVSGWLACKAWRAIKGG